jgi:hypothetical protein
MVKAISEPCKGVAVHGSEARGGNMGRGSDNHLNQAQGEQLVAQVEAEPIHDVEGVELDSRRVNVVVPSNFVLGRIGGCFGMLADDDDSNDDTLEVVFAPASSLVAEAVREVSNGGGWSAQVCQKKKEI